MSEWQSTGAPAVLDELVLDDLDTLAEVTHVVRGPIFRRLKSPRSAAELAAEMDVPVTRLYHHLNALEARGLIRVVATRRVGAVTERRYQVVARSLRLDDDEIADLDPRELAQAFGGLFDVAKVGLQREIEAGTFRADADQDNALLRLNELRLDPDRQVELLARLGALIDEFAADHPDDVDADDTDDGPDRPTGGRFALFIVAHPIRSD